MSESTLNPVGMAEATPHTKSQEMMLPDERTPSRRDVEVANEIPEPAFLAAFKKALLADLGGLETENLLHMDLTADVNPEKQFTYPVVLFSDFPEISCEDNLSHLHDIFYKSCTRHMFLENLFLTQPAREPVPSPFSLSAACLASMHARRWDQESRNLFRAGIALLEVIAEVDNREARSFEMLMTMIFLGMYGVMAIDGAIEQQVGLLICSSLTIARRLRVHDPIHLETIANRDDSPPTSASTSAMENLRSRGIMVWCLWLNDILYGLNHDLAVTGFSSRELWTKMPCSNYEFQEQYQNLMRDSQSSWHLPSDMSASNDGFLLLMAIMSDLVYIQRALGPFASSSHRSPSAGQIIPTKHFIPLSPQSEINKMHDTLSRALDKWIRHFQSHVSSDIMAFYFYIRLHLCCQRILDLPRMAGYGLTVDAPRATTHPPDVSDQAAGLAWQVLDSAVARNATSASEALCPIWLPIVVFHASLVVWAHQKSHDALDGRTYSSRRVLTAFKVELEAMPWPCCPTMVATLERLMASGVAHNC